IEARAQRLPSEEAAAERKLRNVFEILGQGTAVAYATQMKLECWRADILREQVELALRAACLEGVDHQKQADRRIHGTTCVYAGSVRGAHPGHSPTGADANTGALGTFLRESATTGRENNPAGLMYFSRKLRCHSSNISRRQRRPVMVLPRSRRS